MSLISNISSLLGSGKAVKAGNAARDAQKMKRKPGTTSIATINGGESGRYDSSSLPEANFTLRAGTTVEIACL